MNINKEIDDCGIVDYDYDPSLVFIVTALLLFKLLAIKVVMSIVPTY